jgi:catechol 2,3-dioxygenase-like lactoylglutathione lyase family enzyme
MRAERSEPVLPSRDLDETRAFYKAMGFVPWFDGRAWDEYEIMSRGHLVVHFFREGELDSAKNDSGCYLRVTDADVCHASWQGMNLPVEGIPRMTAPRDEPWGMREFTIVDPSGNRLRIGHDIGDAYIAEP